MSGFLAKSGLAISPNNAKAQVSIASFFSTSPLGATSLQVVASGSLVEAFGQFQSGYARNAD
jgi:hypothetical protein